MKKIYPFLPFVVILVVATFLVSYILNNHPLTLFTPFGLISAKERTLMLTFITLMLLVAIPAVLLTFFTAWKYRSTNTKAVYSPEGHHSLWLEIVWWLIPTVLVVVLATITWNMTHAIDPMKPLQSTTAPLTIQVVALRWKWLFIYPKQHIATVNGITFPVGTPVTFDLTAGDAPMNSFWIPSLGGQMYAMNGMINHLHLLATKQGDYNGSDAEISGTGFAGMRFVAKAVTQSDFEKWVVHIQKSKDIFDWNAYLLLEKPSEYVSPSFYAVTDNDLYNKIVMEYAKPKVVNSY